MAVPLLDYSFARPKPSDIVAAGYKGVLRYLSPNAGKNLTADERDGLRAAGLAIGLVWEWYARRGAEGHDAGVQDAQAALTQANALGYPSDLPIFFAIDWDATEGDQAAINDYLNGAKSVIGDRVGIYGGYYPLKRAFDAGIVKWGWQTYAWSGGQWDDRAQIRQTLNGQWGGSVDFDEDEQNLAGLWTASAPVTPAPAPAPLPAPAQGTHQYTIKSGDTFWGLEQANGWTHGTLQNLNPNAVPTQLAIGQQITVPGSGTPAPAPAPTSAHYSIKSGDTFWGLETANGWAHGTLQGLNPGVVPTQLAIGQSINIPSTGSGTPEQPAQHTYGHHTIVSGDTFWGLEATNGWAHGTLEQLNPGVVPTALQIGQVINTP